MDLKGKTAIITGAGRGIGKDISLSLAGEGCNIAIVSRTKKQLEKIKEEAEKLGSKAMVLDYDLTNRENIPLIIEKTLENFGTLDILVNNAAVLFASDLMELSEEEWDNTMAINLNAAFLLSQKAMGVMKKQKSGYIINISSTAALAIPPGIAAYGISKLAMNGLSQVLYEYGKEFGVKVSTIYPGMTDTEMLRGFNPPVDPDKWMLPNDISGCILFLLKQSDRIVVKDIVPWARRHDKI
jgi:NAD(P)-dependent dehydrogenase (short-subunit alcohol dehydrogenase family)